MSSKRIGEQLLEETSDTLNQKKGKENTVEVEEIKTAMIDEVPMPKVPASYNQCFEYYIHCTNALSSLEKMHCKLLMASIITINIIKNKPISLETVLSAYKHTLASADSGIGLPKVYSC